MHRLRFLLLSVTLLAFGVTACGTSTKASAPTATSATIATLPRSATTPPSESVGGPAITISSRGTVFAFSTSSVKVGATVRIKNNTAAQHTVTADTTGGGFDVTVDANAMATFTAPSKPGAYAFHCNIHNYMMGTLTVT